jgi:type IV pilus assembly protein PilZ
VPDSRLHPRKELHPPVAFQHGDGPRREAKCHDIGLGGLFIETDNPPRFGSQITVYLVLPGLKQEVSVKAVVRWTKPTGMGVQFGMMGARETHALMQLLS